MDLTIKDTSKQNADELIKLISDKISVFQSIEMVR